MIYVNIILGGVVLLLSARLWAQHTAIKGITRFLHKQLEVNEGLSTRISAAHEYNVVHHDNWTKLANLVTDQTKGEYITIQEIKKLKHNLGCTNSRVHILETGLSTALPQVKERLEALTQCNDHVKAAIHNLESKQDPTRYYGGTD